MARPDSLEDIEYYYRHNDEELRCLRQQLEYLVTLQILLDHLPPASRILELGAGAGNYTAELLARKHEVTAVDLCPKLVEINRRQAHERELQKKATFLVGDARDLPELLPGKKFNVVLIMGPLYHLVNAWERRALIDSAKKLLEPGGIIISSHMSRVGFISHLLAREPMAALDEKGLQEVWQKGFHSKHARNGHFRGYWTTLSEVERLYEAAGFKQLRWHAQDPCIGASDSHFNSLTSEMKMVWSALLFRLSEDPSIVASARHFLCVATKT